MWAMARGAIDERALDRVDTLARAGLGLDDFLAEAIGAVRRAVPVVAACVATHDPMTRLMTGTHKYGDLVGRDQHDGLYGFIEYESEETTTYRALMSRRSPAVGMSRITRGDVRRSPRMGELMVPHFGYADEARVVFRDSGRQWGGLALFRGPDDGPFDADDVALLGRLSPLLARGVRRGLLVHAAQAPEATAEDDPAAIVVGSDGTPVQATAGAVRRLAQLRGGRHAGSPDGPLASLVAAAQRLARGETSETPYLHARGRDGRWLRFQAAPLASTAGPTGQVVVTIEPARPHEVVELVVAAFGLTARERDIVGLVLRGLDTAGISAALHVSRYTVQDHLKSVFEKAGVRSRRELIARIYFDQYVPRMGAELSPSGWFA